MAATTDPGSTAEPSRSIEIEVKFDVDLSTSLPDLSALSGVTRVALQDVRELDARYLDTETLDLAHAGFALRRRTGGPDAGWHVKGPRAGNARVELGWPLGPDGEDVPAAVRDEVLSVTDAALRPIARIRSTRKPYLLLDADGGVLAEFVDDHVVATDERTGTVRRWREWEFELGPEAPTDADARTQLFAETESAVRAVGGLPAASASKLARALGA